MAPFLNCLYTVVCIDGTLKVFIWRYWYYLISDMPSSGAEAEVKEKLEKEEEKKRLRSGYTDCLTDLSVDH
jgi:hypothetical protein